MTKTIFEQTGDTYTIQGDYCLPNPYITRRRRTPNRRVGAAPPMLFKAASQNPAEYSVAN